MNIMKMINCEHEILKQVTKDEDIVPFISIMPPAMLAFRYIMKCQDLITLDKVLKFEYNVTMMIPYTEEYVKWKEKLLGKKRVLFTEQEREETMREVEGLYELFREKGLVY